MAETLFSSIVSPSVMPFFGGVRIRPQPITSGLPDRTPISSPYSLIFFEIPVSHDIFEKRIAYLSLVRGLYPHLIYP